MIVSKVIGIITLALLSGYVASSSNVTQQIFNLKWAKTAQDTLYNTGQMFIMADGGLAKWNTANGKNILVKSLSKAAGRLAGVFGAFGSLIAVILAFIPGGESAELKLMKKEFGKMSEKMDTIARSLEDTKNLIKIENQKAAFIQNELNIHHGYDRFETCLNSLNDVICNGLADCKRKKVAIAEGFISDLDVRKDVDAIYRGVTSDTAFGSSLLDLLKDESKCNIPKLNLLANKVVALISKGMMVAIFHDLLKQANYNVLDDSKRADKMFTIIENKRLAIQDECIENFDYGMTLDVQDSYSDFKADIEHTNTILVYKLNKKYPWINWHVFTTAGDKKPTAGPKDSARRRLISSSKELKVHCFVVPTNDAKVQYADRKLRRWKELVQQSSGIEDIETGIGDDAALANQVQSYAILPGNQWVLGYMEDELTQHTLGSTKVSVRHMNVFVSRPHQTESYLVAVSFRQTDYPPKCTKSCSGNGKCFLYPYSSKMECRCNPGFSGDSCKSSETSIQLQSNINSILDNTLKLPSFSSIQHTLEDVHMSLLTASENIEDSVIELGNKIDEQFKILGEFMLSTFGWFAILLKYNDAIDNLNYFHSISSSKIHHFPEMQNYSIATLTRNSTRDRFSTLEEKDIVNFLLTPTGIQKWLYQFNFVVVGRKDSEFNSHKPLLFMLMEQYKNRICYEDYKEKLTKAYRQLMLLQLQGYMLWSKAYSFTNRDSSIIASRYQKILKSQQTYLQAETCSIAIPFSKNLHNCNDGYFIHKTMDIQVLCEDGYYPLTAMKSSTKKFTAGKCIFYCKTYCYIVKNYLSVFNFAFDVCV